MTIRLCDSWSRNSHWYPGRPLHLLTCISTDPGAPSVSRMCLNIYLVEIQLCWSSEIREGEILDGLSLPLKLLPACVSTLRMEVRVKRAVGERPDGAWASRPCQKQPLTLASMHHTHRGSILSPSSVGKTKPRGQPPTVSPPPAVSLCIRNQLLSFSTQHSSNSGKLHYTSASIWGKYISVGSKIWEKYIAWTSKVLLWQYLCFKEV